MGFDRTALSEIDWQSLFHAYGPATEVPSLIERLAIPGSGAVNDELLWSMLHQGSRYDSTVAALPFLIDIALDPNTSDRVVLLEFIRFSAMSFSGDRLDWRAQRELQRTASERGCWDAVTQRHDELRVLLTDPDSGVAASSLVLLSWTGDDHFNTREGIDVGLRSGDWRTRLTAYLATTVLGHPPGMEFMAEPAEPDRFGWAVAALRFDEGRCPPTAIDEICLAIEQDQTQLNEAAFFSGDEPEHVAKMALREVPHELRPHASKTLLRIMDSGWVQGSQALEVYLALWLGEPATSKAERVTVEEHGALEALPPRIGTWDLRRRGGRQPLNELSAYGLPDSPERLEAWLHSRR